MCLIDLVLKAASDNKQLKGLIINFCWVLLVLNFIVQQVFAVDYCNMRFSNILTDRQMLIIVFFYLKIMFASHLNLMLANAIRGHHLQRQKKIQIAFRI